MIISQHDSNNLLSEDWTTGTTTMELMAALMILFDACLLITHVWHCDTALLTICVDITLGLAEDLMQQNIDYMNSTSNATLLSQYQYNIDLMNDTIYRLNQVLNCTWVETVFTPIQSEMCDKNL